MGVVMYKEHILVVEDDVDINNLITKTLKNREFQITQAFSGSEASLQLSICEFDIILLDLMLPGITGEELIKQIRAIKEIPIIVISAKTSLQDKIKVLNLGADDYIIKPFESEEIIARVNSQLRRYRKFDMQLNKNKEYKFKELTLDEESRQAKVKNIHLALTAHEFDILCILLKNPNKVYSREALYESVWKNGYYGEDNSVNVHVSNIRKKIKEISLDEEYIKTVWGIGFKLNNKNL
jgi:DNA-binding response OmpR family regulator